MPRPFCLLGVGAEQTERMGEHTGDESRREER
ncbi:UNVERIFIED_ORG: hypothetical protein GGE11_004126 [Mycolicibacterium obuense]